MNRAAEWTRRAVLGTAAAMVLAACGSGDDAGADTVAVDGDVLSGVVREPFPVVSGNPLPSLSDPGTEVDFAAETGGIKVVYFGFLNCPDVCPTTLADYTVARRKLDEVVPDASSRIETLMVTVDPNRDLDALHDYITSFVSSGVAAGTDDDAALRRAAEPFGVSYDVRELDDGTIEVDHSPFLYAVDDEGQLLISWQFGAKSDAMANDLRLLLEQVDTKELS